MRWHGFCLMIALVALIGPPAFAGGKVSISQHNPVNAAVVAQFGSGSSASVSQSGAINGAVVAQFGSFSKSTVTQIGVINSSTVHQGY